MISILAKRATDLSFQSECGAEVSALSEPNPWKNINKAPGLIINEGTQAYRS